MADSGVQQMAMLMLNPQFAAQQQKFALQQQMAQQMMQQGAEQPPTNQLANPGGQVVQNSPVAALARALQQGIGGYMAGKNIQNESAAIQNMNGQQTADQNATGQAGGPLLPWQTNAATGQAQGTNAQQMGGMLSSSNDPNDPINDKAGYLSPDEMIKAHFAYKAQPDAYKIALDAAGGDRAKAQQILAAKAQADADVEHRQGSTYQNMLTGAQGMTPKIPEGATGNFGPSGTITSVAALPIVAPGQQPQSLPAPQGGAQTPQPSQPMNADNAAKLASIFPEAKPELNATPNVIPGTTPGVPVAATPGFTPSSPIPSSQMPLTPGDTKAQTDQGTATIARDTAIRNAAADAPTRIDQLQKIIDLGKSGTKFGPGSGTKYHWEGLANIVPGINPDNTDVANYQLLNKYFSNLSGNSQIATGGTGTDARLEAAQAAYPNPEMVNKAILEIAPYLQAQEKAGMANVNFRDSALQSLQKQGGTNTTAALMDAENQWRNGYDPKVFQLHGMSSQDRQAAISAMPQADREALIKKTQLAIKNGWIQ